MKTLIVATVLVLASARWSIGGTSVQTGERWPGVGPSMAREECGTLLLNADASYENAIAWQYGGVAPPDYGSFAECYQGAHGVCAVVIDNTQVGFWAGRATSVFVWSDLGGSPGTVQCMQSQILPVPGYWPNVTRNTVTLSSVCCVSESWWVGFRGEWPGDTCDYFVGADLDGPGGCAMTNIAPGIGFPTGWQNVSVAWGPTAALGIGVEVVACAPVPMAPRTWGAVKSLYSRH